jgi:hypothetical protein
MSGWGIGERGGSGASLMEIGVYTFGYVALSGPDGRAAIEGQRLRDLIEEVELADQVGLDV